MKAFVTGGTGFIGSHLVDHLIKSDSYSEIRCLVRNQEKWLSGNNYIKIEGDLHDLPALNKGIDGVDVIFHLAAVVKAPGKKEFFHTNVDATENIIRIGQKKGIKNFVILSSLAAAGPSFGKPLTEDKPLMPVSTYGQSKKKMEEMIHEIAEAGLQPDVVVVSVGGGGLFCGLAQGMEDVGWGSVPIFCGVTRGNRRENKVSTL